MHDILIKAFYFVRTPTRIASLAASARSLRGVAPFALEEYASSMNEFLHRDATFRARQRGAATSRANLLVVACAEQLMYYRWSRATEFVRHVALPGDATEQLVLALCSRQPRLVSLRVSFTPCPAAERLLCALLSGNGAAMRLNFVDFGSWPTLTNAGLQSFADKWTAVQHLDLANNTQLTAGALVYCVRRLGRTLRYLSLGNCVHMSAESGRTAAAAADVADVVRAVAASCPRIVALLIAHDPNRYDPSAPGAAGGGAVTDEALAAVAASCPELEFLDLASNTAVAGDGIAAILSSCRGMRRLDLANVGRLRPAGVDKICDALVAAAAAFPSFLRSLDLGGTEYKIAAPVIDRMVCTFAQCAPLLDSLKLYMTNVGDASLVAVATHCPRLETLDIMMATRVTTQGVLAVVHGCRGMRVADLKVGSQRESAGIITDEVVLAMAECWPLLEVLSLSSAAVTDGAIVALASGCRELTNVELRGTMVGTEGTLALGAQCPRLARLLVPLPLAGNVALAMVPSLVKSQFG